MIKHLSRFAALYLLLIVILGGMLLRLWKLGDQSLWIDEGFTIYAAQAIEQYNYPKLASGELYGNGILFSYITSFFLKLGTFDAYYPWQARLPAVFFGIALIPIIYILSRRLVGGNLLPILVSLVTSFSYWEVAWSRQARGYTAASFFVVLAFLFLWNFLKSKKIMSGIGSATALILACLFQASAIAFVPGFILITVIFFLIKENNSKRNYLYGFIIATSVILILCTLKLVIFDQGSIYSLALILKLPKTTILFLLFSVLVPLTLFLNNQYYRQILFFYTLLTTGIVNILLFSPVAHPRYFFIFFPFFIILSVFLTKSTTEFFFLNYKKATRRAITIFMVLVLLYLPSAKILPTDNYYLEWGSPQPDFKSAFQIISSLGSSHDLVISDYVRLHSIYLGNNSRFVSLNLPNFIDITGHFQSSKDRFVGAGVISSIPEFEKIVDQQHGFIILDDMTHVRYPDVSKAIESNSKITELLYSKAKQSGSTIHLYRF